MYHATGSPVSGGGYCHSERIVWVENLHLKEFSSLKLS